MPVPPVPPRSSPPPHRPIGSPRLATPQYYIVKLRDGRPGIVAAADHTKVWVPRIDPRLPHRHDVFWWDELMRALAPKAGFVLYSEDHDTKSLQDPGHHIRKGIVYDAIDMTWLKRAMDMSMDAWTKPNLKPRETEKLANWLLRAVKNMHGLGSKSKDTYEAAEVVKEQLLVRAEVKAVVYAKATGYSGHKATMAQRDSVLGLPLPKGTTTAGGGFTPVLRPNSNLFDSAYVQINYHNRQKVGELVARPHR